MRIFPTMLLVAALAAPASAGVLDLDLGLQATKTAWSGDRAGGAALQAAYWFRPWIGAAFVGKDEYATVDDRYLSYFSANLAFRQQISRLRATGMLGVVHQHEETRSAWMDQPGSSLVGVADGIRHRGGARVGASLALPIRPTSHGDLYVALDVDATAFADSDRGPRWMMSGGLSLGLTYDFARAQ